MKRHTISPKPATAPRPASRPGRRPLRPQVGLPGCPIKRTVATNVRRDRTNNANGDLTRGAQQPLLLGSGFQGLPYVVGCALASKAGHAGFLGPRLAQLHKFRGGTLDVVAAIGESRSVCLDVDRRVKPMESYEGNLGDAHVFGRGEGLGTDAWERATRLAT